jgi:hypothetical protein
MWFKQVVKNIRGMSKTISLISFNRIFLARLAFERMPPWLHYLLEGEKTKIRNYAAGSAIFISLLMTSEFRAYFRG